MQNYSANSLALRSSLILSGILILIFLLLSLIPDVNSAWMFLYLSIPVFFILSFFLLRFIVFRFIYSRIRLIYKTIRSIKEDDQTKRQKFNTQTDLLKQVDEDVAQWVEKNRKEILQWKHMAQYRKEFVGNVSHELKTPIFNIQGYTLTLLEGGLEDKRINQKYLSKIEKNINRMISIVEDLEAITKLEYNQLKLRWEATDPVALIHDVIENLEDKAAKKGISLQLNQHYDKNRKVQVDPEFIRQVLTNLIINGINYGRENGFVKVEMFDMDENLLIEVTDNGIGIEKEDIPRIFERFYRVDKSRSTKSGGTGLGLAIVKHIIEAHKQTLNVRSTPGVGTTVAFTLKKTK